MIYGDGGIVRRETRKSPRGAVERSDSSHANDPKGRTAGGKGEKWWSARNLEAERERGRDN